MRDESAFVRLPMKWNSKRRESQRDPVYQALLCKPCLGWLLLKLNSTRSHANIEL